MAERDVVLISDHAALRAIADPLRSRMLELLATARTVKELAAELGRPPDRLYYHLGLLEKHGLVKVVDDRAAERRYVATSREILIDPGLHVPAKAIEGLVSGLLARVQREFAAARRLAKRGEAKRSMLTLSHVWLTEAERTELMLLLRTAAERYEEIPGGRRDDRQCFGIVTGIWPAAGGPDDTKG